MTSYNAEFITNHRGNPSDDLTDTLMDRIEPYHGAVGGRLDGRLDVTLTYPAESLRQATLTGFSIIRDVLAGTGITVEAVEVMTTADFDQRWGFDPLPDLLSVTEAAQVMGVTGTRVRQLLDEHRLAGVKIGATWAVPRAAAEKRAADIAPVTP